jgi:N-acetylneuraminate synthase
MEFTPPQWRELRDHAHERGLGFIVSPFSVEAVEMLSPFVDAWKVASGEVTHRALLEAIRDDEKPVIFSSGLADTKDLDDAWDLMHFYVPKVVLRCVSLYPCPPQFMGLPLDEEGEAGLSDHSGTIWPAIVYVSRGTCPMVEVHVTLARGTGLLDEASSVTVQELAQLVQGVRFVERMGLASKEEREERLKPMRELFMDRWKRKREEACRAAAGVTE